MEGKKVHVNSPGASFEKHEAHFSETASFDDLAKDGEATPPQSRRVPLPSSGEAYLNTLRNSSNEASNSTKYTSS